MQKGSGHQSPNQQTSADSQEGIEAPDKSPFFAKRVPGSPDNPPESGKCLLGLHPRALDEKKTDFYFRPRCMAPPTAPTRTPAMVTAPATAPTATRRRLRTTEATEATRARTATGTERLGKPLFLVSARPRCLKRMTVLRDGPPETIIRHHMHESQTTCFFKGSARFALGILGMIPFPGIAQFQKGIQSLASNNFSEFQLQAV